MHAGLIIRAVLALAGKSQAAFSRELGYSCTQGLNNKLMDGSNMTIKNFLRITRALGLVVYVEYRDSDRIRIELTEK